MHPCIDRPWPTDTNPLGAKGLGEAGVTGSIPALMNAVLECGRPRADLHLIKPADVEELEDALGSNASAESHAHPGR